MSQKRNIELAAAVIAVLIMALVGGLYFSGNLPSTPTPSPSLTPTPQGVIYHNSVQVSGRVQAIQNGKIIFDYRNFTATTIGSIINGEYNVTLVADAYYYVTVMEDKGANQHHFSLSVPADVTTFTADF